MDERQLGAKRGKVIELHKRVCGESFIQIIR
jgi:hypothetical protein